MMVRAHTQNNAVSEEPHGTPETKSLQLLGHSRKDGDASGSVG